MQDEAPVLGWLPASPSPGSRGSDASGLHAGVMAALSLYLVGMFDRLSPAGPADPETEGAMLIAMVSGSVAPPHSRCTEQSYVALSSLTLH